ncbi:MAG: DUF1778 domain-containing protein [Candidatus Bipolaricaulia bacterium]
MSISRVQDNTAKKARLDLRITADQKELIKRAAAFNGSSMTDFVISAAREAAKLALEEHETMSLTKRDREAFVQALIESPTPSTRLREAARRYKSSKAMGR